MAPTALEREPVTANATGTAHTSVRQAIARDESEEVGQPTSSSDGSLPRPPQAPLR